MISEWSAELTLTEESSKALFDVLHQQDLEFINGLLDGKHGFTLQSSDGRSVELVPAPKWIPCSERLPEEEGNYLVTFGAFTETINGEKVIFGDIDGSVSEVGYGCYERDIFWHPTAFGWYDLATATPFDKRTIIAWMPLPKPWKGIDDDQ